MPVCLLHAVLILLLLFDAGAGRAVEQRIAAVVNDDVISVQDLNDRLQLVLLTSRIPDSEQARARLQQQILRGLIEETLQLQEAERLSLAVEQSEMDRALASIAERNKMTVEQMTTALSDNGINLNTLLDQIRAQIAWLKVVAREIRPKVTVTVDQLDLAVQEARLNQGQPEYLLSEILLPVDNPAQAATVAQDAARLVQTLADGASFESLARQVSGAASASDGGDLGWIKAGSIPPELVGALERLRPGDVSEPIRSAVGFHLFWLRERRLAGPASAADAQVQLTQILFPADDPATNGSLDALRDKAAGMRARLTDCPAMIKVAEELGAPASGDLGWLKLSELPAALGQAVAQLPVGQVSPPLAGPGGIHLLMVCNRKDQGQPQAAPNREQLAERLERERIDRLARRYLRDLRKDAFVEVRL